MADLSPTDRLVRKRNNNLQKQLDVTLQILGEEYRQAKERMYKDERDCGKFLQSLYNTVPGLHTYGQPDTRAMNTNALLKERRYSVSVSVMSGSDSDDLHNPYDPPLKRLAASSVGGPEARPKSSRQESHGTPHTAETSSNRLGGAGRPGPSGRDSPVKTGRGEGHKPVQRPSTAGPQRGAGAQNAVHHGHAHRPSTGFSTHRDSLPPRYGKNAYSEYDRCVQDKVLKKFQVIFNPETEARKVNLSTMATPIVVVNHDSDTNNSISNSNQSDNGHGNNHHGQVIQVNGERFTVDRKPPGPRRVVWSARPSRKHGVVSAPNSARQERPSSDIPPATARATSSLLHSSPLTLTNGRIKSAAATARAPAQRPYTPGCLDPKIQSLALQRTNLDNCNHADKNSHESHPETESSVRNHSSVQSVPHATSVQPSHQHKTPPETQTQSKPNEKTRKQSAMKTAGQNPNPHPKTTAGQNPNPHSKTQPANQLQVPGSQPSPPSHHHHHNGTSPDTKSAAASSRWSTISSSIRRPSSRLSDASEITPPPAELLNKLMKAGSQPGGRGKQRPKTAPSKSELSHRSMPAPRQTVVGILAQIENQKANTRAMLNTSKELQRVVKKLVPWEQPPDLDDW